ncbi:hypothetical protein WJX72_007790 [[Myrmecia] bisecta]|uniref:Peptidase C1A papain C-terminal domain-containing protein n=1 Tax=[Myrmecia] bisecta TaxID=41462 RepID=A0AAW1Q255_9CHLO
MRSFAGSWKRIPVACKSAKGNPLLDSLARMRAASILSVLVLLAACLSSVGARGYGKGKPRRVVPEENLAFNPQPSPLLELSSLPERFNWCAREDGSDWCAPNWNQHIPIYCGSCWAHGTLSMVQDRLKIRKKGRGPDVMLSRQTLLNCGAFEGLGAGCDGGEVADALKYMADFGLPDEACMTYNATDHMKYDQSLKHCPADAICRNCMPIKDVDTCWAVKTPILYKLTSYGRLPNGTRTKDNVHEMMSEIYQRGPITCSITTPDDFVYKYHGGVWLDKHSAGREDVDHDVEVVGWGRHRGVDHWIIRNSWGTFWGELGFFKLERGANSMFVEDGDCWFAEPEFSMEEAVVEGELVGSMYGLVENHAGAAQ